MQFQLPEAALLALSALNGLTLHGHSITVQRPVDESTLDVEVTVGALQTDPLTSRLLYVVSLSPDITELLRAATHSTRTSAEPTPGAGFSGPVQVNGLKRRRTYGLREDLLLDTFSRFGPVVRIITAPHTEGLATHAYVEFENVDSRQASLNSTHHLLHLMYLLCPALTPPHLSARRTVDTPLETSEDTDPERTRTASSSPTAARRLRKLDRRLGKLFRCLPDWTLSVVIFRGDLNIPGICFLEVKHTS